MYLKIIWSDACDECRNAVVVLFLIQTGDDFVSVPNLDPTLPILSCRFPRTSSFGGIGTFEVSAGPAWAFGNISCNGDASLPVSGISMHCLACSL